MARIHPTADVSPQAEIGEGTSVWNGAQIRERARIGRECVISKNVYIDFEVTIGDRCKVQNNASLYHGLTLEDGVFVGPHAVFTNDKLPRAITPDGGLKSATDWVVGPSDPLFSELWREAGGEEEILARVIKKWRSQGR